jgi:hypothetical protein
MKLPVLASVAFFSLGSSLVTVATAQELGDGFLCCNMRTDGSWISDANYMESGKTMIPFGSPVKFKGFGRFRVNLEINGKRQSIGNDYSRDLSMGAFGRRYVVKEDPRPKVAAATAKIRSAIESARVTPGMSKEQVLTALGYPISSENPNLDASSWKFWLWSFSLFTVHFDGKGLVTKVEGDADTMAKVYVE